MAGGAFADYVIELLAPLGGVSARRMFGGHGIYCDGVMFALVADDTLYFKADDSNRPALERAGSEPFVVEAEARRTVMSYWRAPDEAMESPALALPYARAALEAALRARTVRASRTPPARAGRSAPAPGPTGRGRR